MDIKQLMKQAQNMQQQMQEMQKDIAARSYEGQSGAGLVSVTMSGGGEMRKISIDASLLNLSEKEMLEDLIIAAHNNAKIKAEQDSKNSISGTLGNISGLPFGFNS